MGRLLLICRLAARDLRRRRIEAALLLLAFTAATTTLALGLVLNGVTNQPYLQTRNATAGPDVVLQLNPNGSAPVSRKGLDQMAALSRASGVVGHTGPYPATWVKLEANGHAAGAQVEGREIAPASIDRPKITQGSWLQGNGTAVLERTFAQALGVVAGDSVTLNMVVFSWLLGILAIASVTVLVGGRMADQNRRVGLLKAVGGSPRLVAAVLLAEYVLVALVAAAAGLLIGWAVAPLLTSPGAGLLGTGASPGLTVQTVAVTATVAVLVALLGTFIPAVRAARTTTIRAIAAPARPPRRRARLTALSAALPVPMLLGLRIAGRRLRRTALSMAGIAVMVSGIIPILASRARLGSPEFSGAGLDNPITDRLDQILLVVTVMLAVLAAINAIFVTWSCMYDLRYSSALTRALGATRRQVIAGLVAAQTLPAFAGALLGIPLGIGLSVAAQHGGPITYPPVAGTIAVVAGSVTGIVALTAPAASADTRSSIAQTLREA